MDQPQASIDDVIEQLTRARAEASESIELLRASRGRIDENSAKLESPKAVLEYLDFFIGFFLSAAADLDHLIAELPASPSRAGIDTLRQIASNSSAEQRRCLMFRDKWINKPLPYEDLRPVLNQISVDSRDQLTAFRNLSIAADHLDKLAGPPPPPPSPPDGRLGRRALFTRWFGK
jgi:hypothetical protein